MRFPTHLLWRRAVSFLEGWDLHCHLQSQWLPYWEHLSSFPQRNLHVFVCWWITWQDTTSENYCLGSSSPRNYFPDTTWSLITSPSISLPGSGLPLRGSSRLMGNSIWFMHSAALLRMLIDKKVPLFGYLNSWEVCRHLIQVVKCWTRTNVLKCWSGKRIEAHKSGRKI